MGLFDFFKNDKPDTFGLIAYNLSYIYQYIKDNYNGEFPEFDDRILITGTVNITKYLINGELKGSDLQICLDNARRNKVMSKLNVMDSYSERDLLLLFIMNLQCFIFSVDSNFNANTILNSIMQKKDYTTKWALLALDKTKNKNFYNGQLNNHIDSVIHSIEK